MPRLRQRAVATHSTTGPERSLAGEPPRRSSRRNYAHFNSPVLRRPVELAQHTSVAFTTELLEAKIAGSIGTIGDALDDALCESAIGLFKTEAINDGGPTRKDRSVVEWQVARWVHWYNTTRLHSSIDYLPPIEFEQLHRQATTTTTVVAQPTSPPGDPGQSTTPTTPAPRRSMSPAATRRLYGWCGDSSLPPIRRATVGSAPPSTSPPSPGPAVPALAATSTDAKALNTRSSSKPAKPQTTNHESRTPYTAASSPTIYGCNQRPLDAQRRS